MRHRKSSVKLNRTSSHRNAMFRNMVTSLFKHERIRTTDVKAKELRRWADNLITLAKRGDLHARRQALSIIREKDVVHKLFEEATERFGAVSGGYTRIVKLGRRPGDAAPISLIELITPEPPKKKKTKKKKKAEPIVDKQVAAEEAVAETEKTETEPEVMEAESAEISADGEATEAEPVEAKPEETAGAAEPEAVSEDAEPEPEETKQAASTEAEEPQEAKAVEPEGAEETALETEAPEQKPEGPDLKK
ncbi:MAG: 50S ribosomal protein L17 [Deltaproteobacteria bacterium]|nr:50S ribosomal protein L17 [Deltaproteobacteria bacterium]